MIIPIVRNAVDEVDFIIDFFKANFAGYDPRGLTNNNGPTTPSISDVHPLANEYGGAVSGEPTDFSSYLPAIGVELLEDREDEKQFLGIANKRDVEVDQTFIDAVRAVPIEQRLREGNLISDGQLDKLETELVASGNPSLFGQQDKHIDAITVLVSIWSDNLSIARVYYKIVKSLIKRLKREFSSRGAKNMHSNAQNSMYNYDFDSTLYGAEITVTFVQAFVNIQIDTSVGPIDGSKVEEEAIDGIPKTTTGPNVTGKAIGQP